MKLFLEPARDYEMNEALALVRKAFDLQTMPFVLGEIKVATTQSYAGYPRQVQVICKLYPDHMFATMLDPVDFTLEDTCFRIGKSAGQFFAAISNPVPANVVLGEN